MYVDARDRVNQLVRAFNWNETQVVIVSDDAPDHRHRFLDEGWALSVPINATSDTNGVRILNPEI